MTRASVGGEKMAEVNFSYEAFVDQLYDPVPGPTHIRFPDQSDADTAEDDEEMRRLRSRLDECDDCIEKLTEENKALRRKLSILTRPSGITIEDVNIDGPIAQIIYSNNTITKQCRQEIEDCVCGVILRHQKEANRNIQWASKYLKPQPSSFSVDEDPQKLASTSVRTTTEAFKVVGSVLYFTSFSVDKLGQPLFYDSPDHTDGWEVPTYKQIFTQVIGTDGQDIEVKDKRPKSMCFNCGSSAHQLRDCLEPKDMAAINERRKEFNQNQAGLSNQRYHAEVEERFSKYKPGVLSKELLSALGLDANTLPPLIYRMRQLGYPPGWLKEAEMENSGLTLYDDNVSNDSSMTSTQKVSYDVSKLVDFPGFNVPVPHKVKDEFMRYSSVPIQSNHLKHNYAAYLSSHFSSPDSLTSKRPHESDSSQHLSKRPKSSHDSNSDMDIESDPGTPYHTPRHSDFHFEPPPAPGSPCLSSPPPLPHGTPPATPTPPPLPKSTPPPTSANSSPATCQPHWVGVDDAEAVREDELTLEELEEQQRQIWAALQSADAATSSDPETPAAGNPSPDSQDVKGISPKAVAAKVSAVPHRNRFAEGIVPFEDTPEYTEVAEATGTYLRIRDLLKSSPRNLAKKKN
ncbi:zinc finger CCHC domain-containing protein 8 isoform X2 [Festucalex cinctus]